MPEWLRAIGQAAPAITTLEQAQQTMDNQALQMRDTQANLDLMDKPIPLEVHMADNFVNQPEQAKAAMDLYTKTGIIKENDAGSKYLTKRGLNYAKDLVMNDAETKAALRKSQDLDATNEFQASFIEYQKALRTGDKEKIDAAAAKYKDTKDRFSNYINATTAAQRAIEQGKIKPEHPGYELIQDSSGNLISHLKGSPIPKGATLPDARANADTFEVFQNDKGEEKYFAKGSEIPSGWRKVTGASSSTLPLTDADRALAQKVANKEMDVTQLSKRTANFNGVVAEAIRLNPSLDLRAATQDFRVGANAVFKQKALTAETLPQVMNDVVTAGKKLNLSDVQFLGKLEQWKNGQLNDPDFIEYMTMRNDIILRLTSVMRGTQATDEAMKLEAEYFRPTLSPAALEGWLRGNMRILQPMLRQYEKIYPGIAGKNSSIQNKIVKLREEGFSDDRISADLKSKGIDPSLYGL
jgi:hypothetical protein